MIRIYTDCQRAFKTDYGKDIILEKMKGHKPTKLKD